MVIGWGCGNCCIILGRAGGLAGWDGVRGVVGAGGFYVL
jgi:hypothetical protein